MTIHEVMAEALAFCEGLSPEDKGNMLAIVALEKETVRSLLAKALVAGSADQIRFMQVAWFLHATLAALRSVEARE